MGIVRNLLEYKGKEVYRINQNDSVFSALELLSKYDIGALIVVDNHDKIVGIFSERDYARKVISMSQSSKTIKVKEMMSSPVYFMKPGNYLMECLEMMTKKRSRHLPIMDKDKLVGLVSIGDIVNRIISEQKTTIKDLESYIVGSDYGANIKLPS